MTATGQTAHPRAPQVMQGQCGMGNGMIEVKSALCELAPHTLIGCRRCRTAGLDRPYLVAQNSVSATSVIYLGFSLPCPTSSPPTRRTLSSPAPTTTTTTTTTASIA